MLWDLIVVVNAGKDLEVVWKRGHISEVIIDGDKGKHNYT